MAVTAENVLIRHRQGATFNRQYTYADDNRNPIDISSGYTAKMDIRAADGTLLATLQTSDGTIVLGSSTNNITFNVAATVTANWSVGAYQWDFELKHGSSPVIVDCLMSGPFHVLKRVTQ